GTSESSIFSTNDELFSFNFSTILIITLTKSFTFIPEVHYNDKLEHTFVSFLQADMQSEEIFSNFLHKQDIRNIYTLNTTLLEKLNQVFSNAKIFTQINPLYEGCILNENSEVFLNIKDEHFELLIIKNRELAYYNIFEFKNNDEILYFLLLALQEKELNPSGISVSGNVNESADLYSKLKNSFVNIDFNVPQGKLQIGEEFNQVNLHRYFSLLSLHLCA